MPSAMLRTASGNIVTEKENKPAEKPAYSKLILPALRQLNKKSSRAHPTSVPALVKWVSLNYDLKDQRRAAQCIRKAVLEAVRQKRVRQIRQSFILTKAKINKEGEKVTNKREGEKKEKKEKKEKRPQRKVQKKRGEKEGEKVQAPRKRARREVDSSSESEVDDQPKKKTPAMSRARAPKKAAEKSAVLAAAGLKYDHLWQFEHNGWKNYDAKASDTVEEIYLDYLQNRRGTDVRAVKSGQWEYMVDFLALKQTNIQHEAHTIRNIRRVPVSK
ncbi:hypothetical protein PROFUN_06833 [Planoprotostelium fungivorum]|uniref:WWE domain-containing protein n=1 Tax=Planoprotostelium fungivorum TaxID=1890364 RepID=A0A2P6NNC6_9EUKA|nr:hypothetical protein PROFUN_06833 [Planoprotostelium fungivorum]